MKRHVVFLSALLPLFLAACATTGVSSKGALVNVYKPNPVKEAMACTTEGNSIGYPAAQGIASGSAAKKRAGILAKRFVSLPVNYAQIWGYAISQKDQIGMYVNYLEVLVEMERKMKRS